MRHPVKPFLLALCGVLLIACARVPAVAQQPAQAPAGRSEVMMEPSADLLKEIDAARTAFAEAYMKHDALTLSALYHPDAAFAGTLHPYWMEGKGSIERLWTYYFGAYPDAKMVFWSSSLRVLSPDSVVVQYGTATMGMPEGRDRTRNVHMRLTIVWIRAPRYEVGSRSLQWRIAHMHGSEAPLFR